MFGHGQEREIKRLRADLESLSAYYGQLHGKLEQLERNLADVQADVLRWIRRDRERERREAVASTARDVRDPGRDAPLPPPDLRGARLRIWQRKHGGPNGLDHGAPSEGIGDVSSPETDATP